MEHIQHQYVTDICDAIDHICMEDLLMKPKDIYGDTFDISKRLGYVIKCMLDKGIYPDTYRWGRLVCLYTEFSEAVDKTNGSYFIDKCGWYKLCNTDAQLKTFEYLSNIHVFGAYPIVQDLMKLLIKI